MSSTPGRTPSAAVDRKPKTIYQLDSPFTTVSWPGTSPQNQETILELLCSILSPIGQHRTNHVTPSKGKRSKKRKRAEEKKKAESRAEAGETLSIPPTPEISSHIMVGLNSITRSLEALSQASKPAAIAAGHEGPQHHVQSKLELKTETNDSTTTVGNPMTLDVPAEIQDASQMPTHIAAIFVPTSTQTTVLHTHLPQLIFTASLANPSLPPTRLIQLPKGCDARLCDALGLPRVSFIGILEGAPHSKPLLDLVRETVPEIDVPWLREVRDEKYLKVKVNAIETFAPVVAKEKKSV
ncbi:hypothetical protein DL98DRAFT_175372 [Cadophora sp. DSE1049]|nr:hypothetical protein DL98DRAFT_175372 [Cadophora sp. DSE1049]